jgi:hypothetical protein
MKATDKLKTLIGKSDVQTGPEVDERILGEALEHLDELQRARSGSSGRAVLRNPFIRYAVAAGLIIAVLVGLYRLGSPIGSVAWADVAESFRSVPFFSATIYIKQDALAQPEQFELWMGQNGQARMRIGRQIVFSKLGQTTKAFDLVQKQQVEPDPRAIEMLNMLEGHNRYSIETVIRIISGGKLIDVTPLMNADAVIRQDLAVFDVQSEIGPEWARIYALRKSRLPVGIRIWDPRDGGCVDALITYSKDQPGVFFDPQAFWAGLAQHHSEAGAAYMFLKDTGGRTVIEEETLN